MIEKLRRAFRFWVDITSDLEPPSVLAVFRIALGLVFLGSLSSAATGGVLEAMWVDASDGGALHLGAGTWLVEVLGGPTRRVLWSLFGCAGLASVLVTLGFGGRIPYLVLGVTYDALVRMNGNTVGAYDSMLTNALYPLFFSAANRTLSLDCRRKTGAWASAGEAPAWPRYLIVFQLLVMYGATGLQKVSHVWTPLGGYSALYWVFQDPTWRRFDMAWSAWVYPLLQFATALTWHWEIGAPLLLVYYYYRRAPHGRGWLRRLMASFDFRKLFAMVGVSFHVGILIFLNIGPFSFVSLAYYLCLLRPVELSAAFSWFTSGRTRKRQLDAPSTAP
jgi:hypothetical protein